MFTKDTDNNPHLIDLDQARLNPNFADVQKQNEKDADKSLQELTDKFKDVIQYAKPRIGNDIMILSHNDGFGTHCLFPKEMDPYGDMLPMFITAILTVADKYDIDPIHYSSAVFNSVYETLMESAMCHDSQCQKFDKETMECTCTDDCDHGPKN